MNNIQPLGEPITGEVLQLESSLPPTDYEYIATQMMAAILQQQNAAVLMNAPNARKTIANIACDLADALIAEIETRKRERNEKIS